MGYGQLRSAEAVEVPLVLNYRGRSGAIVLRFEPYQSLLLEVSADGDVRYLDTRFQPRTPLVKPLAIV